MQVPEPLAGDVAAQNARSVDAMLACFTDDPVRLRHGFTLDRDRIARPEIDG
ncbi:hypothetical protein [Sorangium sp. So ce1000]|uniref:hypothetical protein n=1 Tax=Sorangium sp. So ce1000 TaxID=3133325 RepID=UPI003F621934